MARFFDKFPAISYSMSGKKYPDYQIVRDILFRTAFIRDALDKKTAYTEYVIRDGDTPDILANKIYGDSEAHWIILYANEILDPQFDWPMTTNVFNKYIADKYRSMAEDDLNTTLEDYQVIAWTQDLTNDASVHHYEKVIKQENLTARVTTEKRFVINKTKLTNNALDVPHDYYEGPGHVPDEQDVTPINLSVGGQTIIQTIYRNFVTYYDYEDDLNEQKRTIRIPKKEYYNQIVTEFNALTNTSEPIFLRKVS
jgi:hypothetical protein